MCCYFKNKNIFNWRLHYWSWTTDNTSFPDSRAKWLQQLDETMSVVGRCGCWSHHRQQWNIYVSWAAPEQPADCHSNHLAAVDIHAWTVVDRVVNETCEARPSETRPRRWSVETETLNWRYQDETKTFRKTPRDCLETKTHETKTTTLVVDTTL